MFPAIPPEAIFIVARFLIAWGSGVLVAHGWMPQAPDQVVNATAQIAVGIAGVVGVTAYGVYRRRRSRLIADVANMKDVTTIHADPPLAAAMQAQGVTNVVATPPNPA